MLQCKKNKSRLNIQNSIILLIRIFIGIVFIWHGYEKIVDLSTFNSFFRPLDVPMSTIIGAAFGYLEIVGGLFLILGIWIKVFSIILALETVFLTINALWIQTLSFGDLTLEYNLFLFLILFYLAFLPMHFCAACLFVKKQEKME